MATVVRLLKENRDPLPAPPVGNPREGLTLDEQKLATFPGEFIRVTTTRSQRDVNGFERECVFKFPSGAEWERTIMGSDLHSFLTKKIGFDDAFTNKLIPYILNNNSVAIYPNERLMKSILVFGKEEVFI